MSALRELPGGTTKGPTSVINASAWWRYTRKLSSPKIDKVYGRFMVWQDCFDED